MADSQLAADPGTEAVARWNADLAFRAVVEATADKAGLEFMRHLVITSYSIHYTKLYDL